MSLRPDPIQPVPEETARVARAAFRKGNPLLSLRDELGTVFAEQYDFVVTLLLLPDECRYEALDAEPEKDVFDRFTAFWGSATLPR